jgi:hypothetical protein
VPSTFVPLPAYPTVLPYPGVPPLLVPPGGVNIVAPVLAVANALGLGAFLGVPQWGIFGQDGTPILEADAVNSFDYERGYLVSDYPQEQGAFQSYNKVQVPYDAAVSFLTSDTRFEFLNTIEAACNSLALVVVVTPEITYPSANLVRYKIRTRTSRSGVTMVTVDVWLREIRVTAGASLSSSQAAPVPAGKVTVENLTLSNTPTQTGLPNAQSPDAASPVSGGSVQPVPPEKPVIPPATPPDVPLSPEGTGLPINQF